MADAKSTFPHVASRATALQPGTMVAKTYEITGTIGEGGMSRVYAARNVWTHREVAIKMLAMPRVSDERARTRFISEAKTAARLTHPNIVRVLDLGTDDDGCPFIVHEHIRGESLTDCLTRLRCLSESTAIKIFVPILDALTMAHDNNIVHRDVTPNNILLAEQPGGGIIPKLSDFGVAKELSLDDAHRLTQDGSLVGTPLFMSPEQVRAESVDGRSDVWSVGACLYLALTSRVPFQAKSLVELAAQIIMAPVRRPSERRPKISEEMDTVVLRALEKDPSARYRSARDMRDALLALLSRGPADSLPPEDEQVSQALDSARQPLTGGVDVKVPSADVGALKAASRARPLRVGMVLRNAETHARIEQAFASSFGIRCDVWCYFEYAELVDALSERDIEFAWLPPVAYVRARRAKNARLLLTVERSGQPTYASAVLARKGFATRLDDLSKARAVWVDPWSAAGYLMPLSMLRAKGLDPSVLFSSQAFVGSHDAVLEALVAKSADVGATHCTLSDAREIVRRPWDDGDELVVLDVSGPIPGDTFCSAPKVSTTLRQLVCDALLDTSRSGQVLEALGASRMVEGRTEAYAELEQALLGGC